MELIERTGFLTSLQSQFEKTVGGEGHCVFISGESGIGKTSLVKAFCNEIKSEATIYTGTCDALFTPRPLAPLYDIAWHIRNDFWEDINTIEDRASLFTRFLHEFSKRRQVVLIFEDIHWADEATLDFIKFFTRRITQTSCLFILTYRDNEIHARHPLKNVLGELIPGSFTRLQLTPLSRTAVEKLSLEKGYSGEDVFSISGGNPFYVNEILASYSPGVPDNIKDSILAVHSKQNGKTKYIWDTLAMLPTGLEIKYLEQLESQYEDAIEYCLGARILIVDNGLIRFKHELYRRTIEESLSPLKRIALNKTILDLFKNGFEENNQTERIIHHAKNANEYELVVQYAPLAARQAAGIGSHIEAARLYLSAIEYYQGNDVDVLIQLYEPYAYECYLTNQVKEAIIYQGKALQLYREKNDIENVGNSLRFLSRLWWFDGKRKQAESFGWQAIEVLKDQPSSRGKAMAYSNMSQLEMLADQTENCISWADKAITIAHEINDEETIAHALNSKGSALMTVPESMQDGISLLHQSMKIALKNSFHEHVARAYTALGTNAVTMKDYVMAKKNLEEGIQYCEEKDLDSLKLYMLSSKARLTLETGYWKEALDIAGNLLKNENLSPVIKIGALTVVATINMRRGDPEVLPLLNEAKNIAFETMEVQRIIPAMSALLEYEWISGKAYIETEIIDRAIKMMVMVKKDTKKSKLYYWLGKSRKEYSKKRYADHVLNDSTMAHREASEWKRLGCPYEQALALFEGSEDDKRIAINMIHELGGDAVYEKMKQQMRSSGIKKIPRGIRETTMSNPAQLTSRELDVLELLKDGMQNKEIASTLFISVKTVDHHISSILFKLEVNSRNKAVQEAMRLEIIK